MTAKCILTAAALLAGALTVNMAQGAEHPSSRRAAAEHPKSRSDLVSVASSAGGFTTLVTAIQAAGLVETLQGTGPFTVFAPTDDAFAKLPAGTLEDLLKPENKEKLVSILTYHVVPGKVMAADVKTMEAGTVNGKKLSIKVADGKVTVNGAEVVKTDVAADNGVIHVIDAVLLPPAAAEHPAAAKPKDHPSN